MKEDRTLINAAGYALGIVLSISGCNALGFGHRSDVSHEEIRKQIRDRGRWEMLSRCNYADQKHWTAGYVMLEASGSSRANYWGCRVSGFGDEVYNVVLEDADGRLFYDEAMPISQSTIFADMDGDGYNDIGAPLSSEYMRYDSRERKFLKAKQNSSTYLFFLRASLTRYTFWQMEFLYMLLFFSYAVWLRSNAKWNTSSYLRLLLLALAWTAALLVLALPAFAMDTGLTEKIPSALWVLPIVLGVYRFFFFLIMPIMAVRSLSILARRIFPSADFA